MRHSTRRMLTGALLVLAAGTGVSGSPAAGYAAGVRATIDVNSALKVRSAPSLTAKVVGSLRDNQKIDIACQVSGQSVRGKVRTTAVWDRLADGRYVSHGYVRTSAKLPACQPAAAADRIKTKAAAYVPGRVRSSDGSVNVRRGPSTQSAGAGRFTNGAALKLVCSTTGTRVSGTVRTSSQWDRLTDGRYISHAYVVSAAVKACPAAKPAPAVATPAPVLTPEQFIKAAVPGAQQGWRQYGVPPSVTIAQAILESGWGKSSLSATDRNYFGIKCQAGYYGPHATGCHVYKTNECTKAGRCFETSDAFRTYASMARSFRDHGHFLRNNKRYAPAFTYTKDANKFIWQVWKAGYATDPKYYTKVTGIMATYDLYRYNTWK
ncbi:sporangiospore maturation cell wall hydrolase GsmA [Actinoplanes aureus]|uniref:Sporangiospore maturation cell wall hydrolase GsmA n=1 Tax=Actinoplanes aureus TaxID=2792083 RepID=A0A931CCR7_9ACTN|nr:sporangiospore maturation cell wall hydrolase GsmA [Actinoplanes aureus]MBG0567515.1 sporangiospore maturation cell wall hydrolase GsmA [Actinoplanes aureus]